MVNRSVVASCGLILLLGSSASAQVTTGNVTGRVVDASASVLPGVTVTLTGTGVMGERTAVTDESGIYRLSLLPPGTYALRFEMPGFAVVTREGVGLTAGFSATINAELQLSSLAEVVTVSGGAPLVDLESTTVASTFSGRILTTIPNGRDMWSALAVTPGVQMTRHDVGSYSSGSQSGYRTYGADGQNVTAVDGVIINDGNSSTGIFLDYGSFEEIQVTGASKGAQSQLAGANTNLIVKTGGNLLHGMGYAAYSNDSFQGDNLTDEARRRGFNGVNSQVLFRELNANAGGPFVKDRLWWFGSVRHTLNKTENPVFTRGSCTGADSCLDAPIGTVDFRAPSTESFVPFLYLWNVTSKFNFKVNPANQISYTSQRSDKRGPFYDAFGAPNITNARFFNSDSVSNQFYPGWYQTLKWQSALSSRAMLDLSANNFGFDWTSARRVNEYSVRDLDTQAIRGGYSGRAPGNSTNQPYPNVSGRRRWHYNLNLAYSTGDFIKGQHNIDTGYVYSYQTNPVENLGTVGHFILYYRGGFTTPAFFDTVDTPFNSENGLKKQGAFFNDRWHILDNLTLNLGVRLDTATAFYPDQVKDGSGPYQSAQTVPGHDFPLMNRVVPRLSVVYDPFGTGRTAIKASYSRYTFDPAESLAGQGNPTSATITRYNWDGTLPFNPTGLTPVSVTGGPNRSVDPNLVLPYTDEFTVGVDQQISNDLALRLGVVRKLDWRMFQQYNVAIPFEAYNIPVSGVDPGRDGITGTSDDSVLELYSLDPAFNGRNVGFYTNNPGVDANYTTIEASVTKRFANRYQFMAGWDSVYRSLNGGVPQDPNTFKYRPQQKYWGWTYKTIGFYDAPFGVTVSGAFRASKGEPYGRRVNSPRLNQGVVALQVEPSGTFFTDTVALLDFRAEKRLVIDNRWGTLNLGFDLFNILNSGAITAVADLTGPSFQTVSQTLTPRIFRLSMRYEF